MSDAVNHPPHYNQGGVECIDAIRAALGEEEYRGFLRGQVLKYLWRSTHKGAERQDYLKAQWYLNRLIGVTRETASNAPDPAAEGRDRLRTAVEDSEEARREAEAEVAALVRKGTDLLWELCPAYWRGKREDVQAEMEADLRRAAGLG